MFIYFVSLLENDLMKPSITIEYCPQCRWMLRAAYMAQEILSTFENDLELVSLKPGQQGGVFRIYFDDTLLFDRAQYGGFPEIKAVKQWIRDQVEPERDLGHIDGTKRK